MPAHLQPRVKVVFVSKQAKAPFFRCRKELEAKEGVRIFDDMTKAERARERLTYARIGEAKAAGRRYTIGWGGTLQVDGRAYGDLSVPLAEWRA
jgi:hypothetical protein